VPNLSIKGLSPSTHRSLKHQAKLNKRSLNQEIISVLEANVSQPRKVDMEKLIAEAERFRSSLQFTTTPEEIDAFKRMGRE
jgi:plasmid stability protein